MYTRCTVSAHRKARLARAFAVTHAADAARVLAEIAAAAQVDRRVGRAIVPNRTHEASTVSSVRPLYRQASLRGLNVGQPHPVINGKEASVVPSSTHFEPAGHRRHSTDSSAGRRL